MTVGLLDLRAQQPYVHDDEHPGFKPRADGHAFKRDPKTVCGIGIHQTACHFGPAADPAKKHRRALNVHAHMTAFDDGVCVLGWPLEDYVFHGNGLNAFTLGLECEGIWPGTGTGHIIPDKAIETYRFGLKTLVEMGRDAGMPIEYVWAHRQSSDTRRGDPGWEIWQRVVLEYGVLVLGLKTENWKTFRDQGYPIPHEWDPASAEHY